MEKKESKKVHENTLSELVELKRNHEETLLKLS
jgi:hypothetical protein